jgi:hypothetical protein
VRRYPVGWLFWDDNSLGMYAPLIDEPDLFVKFASLASKDPGTRDGRYDIMLEWIKSYGVLGLRLEGNPGSGLRSERDEYLLPFWTEVQRAAACMTLYEAATGPTRLLKGSGVSGKTLAEKRKSATRILSENVHSTLKHHCYPKLYYQVREDNGETTDVGLGWGFHSLLGAMYLQMAWRITSRRCEAPGCNNIIGLHERSNNAKLVRFAFSRIRNREAAGNLMKVFLLTAQTVGTANYFAFARLSEVRVAPANPFELPGSRRPDCQRALLSSVGFLLWAPSSHDGGSSQLWAQARLTSR